MKSTFVKGDLRLDGVAVSIICDNFKNEYLCVECRYIQYRLRIE